MLCSSFIHIPGVGPRTERHIWERGILTWDQYLAREEEIRPAVRGRKRIRSWVEESRHHLQAGDYRFFARNLPPRELWRAYPEFKEGGCFLDIETTGLGLGDEITLVGIYDGREVKSFIRGINMKELAGELKCYSLIVTYNGACFDLPFLRAHFPRMRVDQIHIDLRYPLARLGYRGGLKEVERTLSIERSPETARLDGFDAVRLWREYQRGSEDALSLLLKYNREDVVNLEKLMDFAYGRLRAGCLG